MSRGNSKRRPAARRGGGPQRRGGVNWVWVVVGVAVVGLFTWMIVGAVMRSGPIADVQTYGPFPANQHVSGTVSYQQNPPAGGEHSPGWQNCGIYYRPVQDENAVHSMEHGAVWITYAEDLPADQVEQLRGLVRGKSYTLLSPRANMPVPVAASAWGVQIQAQSASDARLERFIAKYRQGPQTPEPGAACVGGSGAPDER